MTGVRAARQMAYGRCAKAYAAGFAHLVVGQQHEF
jgi:hypothetical protein